MNRQTPFPGMDPYLEHPSLWPDVHNRLITSLADFLSPQIAPNYYVGVESRAYVLKPEGDVFLGRPDVAIIAPAPLSSGASTAVAEAPVATAGDTAVLDVDLGLGDLIDHYYLEIRAVQTHQLITAIELLSPVNKTNAYGRAVYLQKREEALLSQTNYIEIDLLRAGDPMPLSRRIISDYRILVNRGWRWGRGQLFAFGVRAPIPDFPLPLMPNEDEVTVPLNQILHDLYGRARFDLRLDYSQPALPPLGEEDAAWASALLAS